MNHPPKKLETYVIMPFYKWKASQKEEVLQNQMAEEVEKQDHSPPDREVSEVNEENVEKFESSINEPSQKPVPPETDQLREHRSTSPHAEGSGSIPCPLDVARWPSTFSGNGGSVAAAADARASNECASSAPHPETKGKNMTSKYRQKQINLLIQELSENKQFKKLKNLPNLNDLIQDAVRNSQKELPNEAKFYNFLLQSNLFWLVKNRHKIKKYYKGAWYHI